MAKDGESNDNTVDEMPIRLTRGDGQVVNAVVRGSIEIGSDGDAVRVTTLDGQSMSWLDWCETKRRSQQESETSQ